jgi:hypothetical protein
MAKLLLHDMKGRIPTPAFCAKNANYLETLPYDGIILYPADANLTLKLANKVMTNVPHGYDEYFGVLNTKSELPFSSNFVLVLGNRPTDFFDPWDECVKNFYKLAAACYDAGIAGIFFDNEAYPGATEPFNYYPGTCTLADDFSQFEYQSKAFQRGSEVMTAMQSAYPGIKVITTHGPYVSTPACPLPLPRWYAKNQLLGPFFAGMMDASEDRNVIDGGELYTLRAECEFQSTYDFRKSVIAWPSLTNWIPDNLAKAWARKAKLSWGLMNSEFGGREMSPEIFSAILTHAQKFSDEYVWTYIVKNSFLQPSTDPMQKAWLDVINSALI